MTSYALQPAPREPTPDYGMTIRIPDAQAKRVVEIPVTACDGSPGRGARVTLDGKTAIADARGIATFEDLQPGTYTLTIAGVTAAGTPATAEVVAVHDTFTDADGTDIEDHTGEVGATWEIDDVFGQGDPSAGPAQIFRIDANGLRRTTFAEDFHFDGGEALARPSGTLPSGWTRATIEFGFHFRNALDGFIGLYQNANNSGNPDFLCWVASAPFGGATGVNDGSSFYPFVAVQDQSYVLKLEIDDNALTILIDDVTIAVFGRPAQPVEPFGIDIFDQDSEGTAVVEYARIYVPASPAVPGTPCADRTLSFKVE